jgi:hypothetical protein
MGLRLLGALRKLSAPQLSAGPLGSETKSTNYILIVRLIHMFYKQDSSNFKQLLPGICMKPLTFGDNSLLCEFQLKQGSIIPPHEHSQEQTGYLISGRLRFSSLEGEFIAEPGSSWNFKGGIQHSAEVLQDSVAIELFSPIRQEYLS